MFIVNVFLINKYEEIRRKKICGLANYKFDERFSKFKIANPKWCMQST